MASFEHLRDVQPEPATYTVPTEKMRNGDFSEFSDQIYDPFTATGAPTARGRRSPATSIPRRVASTPWRKAYAALYPLPNRPGTRGNYFTNQLRPYDYNVVMGRVDHNFTGRNRLFATPTGTSARKIATTGRWAPPTPPATASINGFLVTKGFDYRSNTGVTRRLHLRAVVAPAVRHARQLVAVRRVARPGAGLRPRHAGLLAHGDAADRRLQLPAAHHVRRLQHDERELDHRLARVAALRLGQRLQPSDGHLSLRADADQDLGRAHRRASATTCACSNWKIINDGYPGGRYTSTARTPARTIRRR